MVSPVEVPPHSLLGRYAAGDAYVDCYVTALPARVTHAQFVEAFYTTALFKLERRLLGLFLSRPSTDTQARQLAEGQRFSFAAWTVESRAENQLLLAAGRTRSWLMVTAGAGTGTGTDTPAASTRLFFGSAVVPRRSSSGSRGGMGFVFTALLGFHQVYSRALLLAARDRLSAQIGKAARSNRGDA